MFPLQIHHPLHYFLFSPPCPTPSLPPKPANGATGFHTDAKCCHARPGCTISRRNPFTLRQYSQLKQPEVCRILQVSPRTLQTLRSNGTLGYSQIVRKVYYRAEDVQRIIPVVEERRRRAALKGKSI